MEYALKRLPNGQNTLKDVIQAEEGIAPYFTVKDGQVSFARAPTLQDGELLLRTIKDEIEGAYASGGTKNTLANRLQDVEAKLRESLNGQSSELKRVREEARQRRAMADAFKAGKKILTESGSESAELIVEAMRNQGDAVYDAFKLGYRATLKGQTEGQNKAGWAARLADEGTKEGRIFREIMPEQLQEDALKKLGVAAQAKNAANEILGGSQTAETLMKAQQIGKDISASELVGVARLDPSAILNTAGKILDQLKPRMTAEQKAKVAQVLVSRYPEEVRKALTDKSYLMAFSRKIDELSVTPYIVGSSAAASVINDKLKQ